MTKETEDYKGRIATLLAHYEDGWDIFKKAPDWNYPVRFKEGVDDPTLPRSWLELVERVQGIIAHDKYGLNTFENTIALIDSNQMLDMYTSIGLPHAYQHWSFGKSLIKQEEAYQKGRMGLAYEIVINTNPAIAYCMTQNTKTMQMLVIAHASFGHNHFFKNNHLFRQFTSADNIERDLKIMKSTIEECEEKYGAERVEQLLDMCHALDDYGVDRTTRPFPLTPEQQAERLERMREARRQSADHMLDSIAPRKMRELFNNADIEGKTITFDDENLLRFIATTAPHLEPWQRKIINMICDKAQYLYPQSQTQVMNEGCATKMHLEIMREMQLLGLIDDGMALEVEVSTNGVTPQFDFDSKHFGGRFNPYALGLAICNDIERMCVNPTEEDKKWFPAIAGSQDWMKVLRHMWANFRDEDAILQFLSPKVMRDFKMFVLKDDDQEATIEIAAIHSDEGYEEIRNTLASSYRRADNQLNISKLIYNFKTDRALTIVHEMHNRRPVDEPNMTEILKHIHRHWGHPIYFQSVNEQYGVEKLLRCPSNAITPPEPSKPAFT